MFIIAHRGASGLTGQDNTLASFERAIALGCDFVELDVRKTADNTIVCFHDPSINGKKLCEITFAELNELAEVPVPTLAEATKICASRIGLLVELKEKGYEKEVINILKQNCGESEIHLQSFQDEVVDICGKLTDWPKGLLVDRPENKPVDFNGLKTRLENCGADFLAAQHAWLHVGIQDSEVCKEIPLYVWTVDKPEIMRAAKDAGVKGLITNRPDYALAAAPKPMRKATDEWVEERARQLG